MELTWVAAASLVTVGVGYAFVQRVQQSPLIAWTVIATTLFVLSTRDLLRSREQLGAGGPSSGESADRSSAGAERRRRDAGDGRNRPTLLARFRRRVGSWLT